jgi:hypothetical protein
MGPFVHPGTGDATEANVQFAVVEGGTLSNFKVFVSVAPASGKSWTFTVRKNAADTTVTCTITGSATSCSDTTHSVGFVPGDLRSVKIVPASGPDSRPAGWVANYG